MTIMYVGSIPKDIVTIVNYNCTFKDLEQVYIDDPIAALLVSKQKKPDVVFVDANMKLLNGYSFSAIISGYNDNGEIFLITNKENKNTAGLSDVHIISFPYILSEIVDKIQAILEKHAAAQQKSSFCWSSRIGSATDKVKKDQRNTLPAPIKSESGVNIDYIFSPYDELSGDCLDFWYSKKENIIYGFLFDCTGHDIHSFTQVREMRTLFRLMFALRRDSLNKCLQNVNNELFRLYADDTYCTAAVTFEINLNTNLVRYCSAGIPYFWIKENGEYEQVFMENFLIGCEPGCEFEESQVSIYPGKEVIFCSDGLSELLGKDLEKLKKPQQDDISSVFISLDGGVQNEVYKN